MATSRRTRRGSSRDHRPDRPQIVFGLLCTTEGCPVAVEVFEGNLGDPATLASQVKKLRVRFRLKRIVLVGDRGMITKARIDADVAPAGLDWITALRAPAIKALAAEGGPLQLSLFDERDMAEIVSDDYPGERLVVCRNSELAAERARKRVELLDATEASFIKIRAMTEKKRNPLRGADKIALKVGTVINRRRMAKHFDYEARPCPDAVQGRQSRSRRRRAIFSRRQSQDLARGVAEADAVSGQVGEVLQEGAEAVDRLAVFGAPADGLAARPPYHNPVEANPNPDPSLRTPRPQDRRVGRPQFPYRVTSKACVPRYGKFGLGEAGAAPGGVVRSCTGAPAASGERLRITDP